VAVVAMRFLDSEGEVLRLALGVVRTAHQCRRLWMARVRVAGSKATNGLIGGVGEMVEVGGARVVVDMMAPGGAREDLEVVDVAQDGMDQVDSEGADDIELSSFCRSRITSFLGAHLTKGKSCIYCNF